MTTRIVKARPEHQVARKDLVDLMTKHGSDMTSEELLALAAHTVGTIIALQDQRTMTPNLAMAIVMSNIAAGNQETIDNFTKEGGGRA